MFNSKLIPGDLGKQIAEYEAISMLPPFPWGLHFYANLFKKFSAKLEGDLIEMGVGKGGTSIFLGKLAKEHKKLVYSWDNFRGLPKPSLYDNPYFRKGDFRSASKIRGSLLENFNNLINEQKLTDTVIPIVGQFNKNNPALSSMQKFCFVHLDSDLYQSIYKSLEITFDKTAEGGLIIIDEFFHPAQGPYLATTNFLRSRNIFPTFHVIFPYAVAFFKSDDPFQEQDINRRCFDGNKYSLAILKEDEHFLNALNKCLKSCPPYSNAYNNCITLLKTLDPTKKSDSKDIYSYWKAMEEFWDMISERTTVIKEI